LDDELPDPALFWRWVGGATRPVVGWVLAGLGVIAILIGYLGISRESLVAKQLPYLISGGIGGIALVGAGAALIATEDLRRFRTRLDRLEAMIGDLHGVLLSRPDAPSGNGQRAARARSSGELVALPAGRSFHRADCVMVEGKDGAQQVSAAAAQRRGLEPCRLCEPESVTA
ncbi:MAG: hypothetical protein QOH74_201, partial [Gaiellales bacterium]|nr:hypothetical protein [Gaiellales bacterium]